MVELSLGGAFFSQKLMAFRMKNEFEQHFEDVTGLKFEEFYRQHKPKLTWHLARWTKNLEVAEDYADEAFIQALHKIDLYNKNRGAQVHTWLYVIADNLVKKDFREAQRMPTISMDREYAEHATLAAFLPYDDGRKELESFQLLTRKADLVKKAITEMPAKQEKYQRVLVMREIEHMSYNDIAQKLQLNLSTVKSQIKKGRELVVKKVEKKFAYLDQHGLF